MIVNVTLLAAAAALQSIAFNQGTQVRRDSDSQVQTLRAAAAGTLDASPGLVETIQTGLANDDASVRFLAMSALSHLTLKAVAGVPLGSDPRLSRSLKATLLKTLEDPDSRVRGAAVKTLALLTRWPDATLEEKLVDAAAVEVNLRVKALIIHELGVNTGRSLAARSAIRVALQDGSSDVRQNAALAATELGDPLAIPVLADELQSGDPHRRGELAHALSRFGPIAKPYISLLQSLMLNEVRPNVTQHIKDAILAIQSSR